MPLLTLLITATVFTISAVAVPAAAMPSTPPDSAFNPAATSMGPPSAFSQAERAAAETSGKMAAGLSGRADGRTAVRPSSSASDGAGAGLLARSRLGAICFFVTDLKATETFYREVLGLAVQRMKGAPSDGDWLMARTVNGLELIFFQQEVPHGGSPVVVFELAEGGIEDVVKGLARKGAVIVSPVSEAPGGWSAEFKDPSGHVLSLFQPAGKAMTLAR